MFYRWHAKQQSRRSVLFWSGQTLFPPRWSLNSYKRDWQTTVSNLAGGFYIFRGKPTLPIANDNINPADTETALSAFVIALARNQARIDHGHATGAANDNTRH
jgi:hypothetical protein